MNSVFKHLLFAVWILSACLGTMGVAIASSKYHTELAALGLTATFFFSNSIPIFIFFFDGEVHKKRRHEIEQRWKRMLTKEYGRKN